MKGMQFSWILYREEKRLKGKITLMKQSVMKSDSNLVAWSEASLRLKKKNLCYFLSIGNAKLMHAYVKRHQNLKNMCNMVS